MSDSAAGAPSEAYGRILIADSQIAILSGDYVEFPQLDEQQLVAAADNYVAIGAVCNGTTAGVHLAIHQQAPEFATDESADWEDEDVATSTFTTPPFFMVGDSLQRGGIDLTLEDCLDLDPGKYTFRVRAKGLLDAQEQYVYRTEPPAPDPAGPPETLIQQFRIDVWPTEAT